MDYQEAKRIRKTNLFKLIAERKFEEGEGLGSSIGGAISEKFKAKATGIKESFDPLNITRKAFGKGLLGDLAVTGLGRLSRRKQSDIGYFGGFQKRNKKDPNYSSITPGVVRPLKYGDSTVDIIGKMYNFMLKTDEKKKVHEEIESSFRQEQIDEDERRHQELVKAIRKFLGKKPKSGKSESDAATPLLGGLMDSLLSSLLNWQNLLLAALGAALLDFLPKGMKIAPVRKPPKTNKPSAVEKPAKPSKPSAVEKPATPPKPSEVEKGKKSKVTETKPSAVEKPATPPKKVGALLTPKEKRTSASKSPEVEKPTATKAEKAAKVGRKALKVTNKVALTTLTQSLNVLSRIPFIKQLAVFADLSGEIQKLIDDSQKSKLSGEEILFQGGKIFAKFLGGLEGMELGGLIGASIGGSVGGPWGALAGTLGGAYIGTEFGEELAGALFEYVITGKLPEINYPQAVEYAKEHGFVIGEEGAAFGTQVRGVKPRMLEKKDTTPKNEPVKVTTPVQKNTTVPTKIDSSDAGSPMENIAVNNTVNNIGGKKPKVLQLSAANQRNKDLDRYLRNTVVPV